MKRNLTKKNAFSLTFLLWKFISARRKKPIKLLMILIIFSSFAEFITVYLLVPYLRVLTNPEIIFQNKFFKKLMISLTLNSSENIIFLLTLFFIIAIIISGLVRLIFNFYTFNFYSLIGSDLSVRAYMNTINSPISFT